MQRALEVLNPSNLTRIPNWLLKEYCDLVAYTKMEFLNASYPEQHPPTIWKMDDMTPLPKNKPVVDIKKELRLIVSSMTCVSEVARFVAGGFVKFAVMSDLHDNQ